MPLTKRQFELQIDQQIEGWMRQVYELLETHQDLAYSGDELRHELLGDSPAPTKAETFGRALETLDSIGAVEKREVHDLVYYAFNRKVDTDNWELDLSLT